MKIETWCCINDQGESPHQNVPLAKGYDAKQTWKTFWRVYRNSVSWGKFMLVLKYQKAGKLETISIGMNGLSLTSYSSIMYARGEWEPVESFCEA